MQYLRLVIWESGQLNNNRVFNCKLCELLYVFNIPSVQLNGKYLHKKPIIKQQCGKARLFITAYGIHFLTEATLCYQCSDAKSNGDCARDIDGLLEDRQRYFQETNITTAHFSSKFTFLKNCSGLWGEYCLFEHIREAGTMLLICSL